MKNWESKWSFGFIVEQPGRQSAFLQRREQTLERNRFEGEACNEGKRRDLHIELFKSHDHDDIPKL